MEETALHLKLKTNDQHIISNSLSLNNDQFESFFKKCAETV